MEKFTKKETILIGIGTGIVFSTIPGEAIPAIVLLTYLNSVIATGFYFGIQSFKGSF